MVGKAIKKIVPVYVYNFLHFQDSALLEMKQFQFDMLRSKRPRSESSDEDEKQAQKLEENASKQVSNLLNNSIRKNYAANSAGTDDKDEKSDKEKVTKKSKLRSRSDGKSSSSGNSASLSSSDGFIVTRPKTR